MRIEILFGLHRENADPQQPVPEVLAAADEYCLDAGCTTIAAATAEYADAFELRLVEIELPDGMIDGLFGTKKVTVMSAKEKPLPAT